MPRTSEEQQAKFIKQMGVATDEQATEKLFKKLGIEKQDNHWVLSEQLRGRRPTAQDRERNREEEIG